MKNITNGRGLVMQLRMRRADGQRKQTREHLNDKHCKIHYNLTMQLICKLLSVINLDMRMYGSIYFIQIRDIFQARTQDFVWRGSHIKNRDLFIIALLGNQTNCSVIFCYLPYWVFSISFLEICINKTTPFEYLLIYIQIYENI